MNNSNHNPLPDLHSTYLDLLARALPNVADMGDRVSAMITLVQDAGAILRDGEPDAASRAEVALTAVLAALKLTSMELDRAAQLARAERIGGATRRECGAGSKRGGDIAQDRLLD